MGLAGAHLQPQHQVGNLEGLPGPGVQQPATAQHQPYPHCRGSTRHTTGLGQLCRPAQNVARLFWGGKLKLPLAWWHRATLQAVALPCLRLECCLEVRVVAAKPLSPSKGTYVYV
jgi:hypothetical protein